MLTVEKLYSINFTENNKKLCLTLHSNETNSYLYISGTELLNLKQKTPKL